MHMCKNYFGRFSEKEHLIKCLVAHTSNSVVKMRN